MDKIIRKLTFSINELHVFKCFLPSDTINKMILKPQCPDFKTSDLVVFLKMFYRQLQQ